MYEPESFTPLVQLSTKASAQAKPQVLALMAQSQDEDENGDDNAQMVAMLDALPQDMRQALEQSLRQAMQDGIPQSIKTLMPDQGQNMFQRLTGLREQLEKQEQTQQTPITVRHYHCDHLGTPIALTDEQQNIVWAARLDPWGNLQEEFNPNSISQPIRLPGQHHDKDTGLYYNRHRYYDPSIGAYVNQDPIGLGGGVNGYVYPINPQADYDPWGLQKVSVQARRTGTRQPAIFDSKMPDAKLNEATSNSIKTNKDQASVWDNLNDLINPNNHQRKRIDEALVCKKQKNTSTGEIVSHEGYLKGEPSIIPLDKPFPPSPDGVDAGWICIDQAPRPGFRGGPPPGL